MGEYYQSLAIGTLFVFWIGRSLRRSIGAKSEAKRIHGRYVFWWSVGAYAVGGAFAPLIAGYSMGAFGLANFCLLAGWLVGTTHGAIVLARRPPAGLRRRAATPPFAARRP